MAEGKSFTNRSVWVAVEHAKEWPAMVAIPEPLALSIPALKETLATLDGLKYDVSFYTMGGRPDDEAARDARFLRRAREAAESGVAPSLSVPQYGDKGADGRYKLDGHYTITWNPAGG